MNSSVPTADVVCTAEQSKLAICYATKLMIGHGVWTDAQGYGANQCSGLAAAQAPADPPSRSAHPNTIVDLAQGDEQTQGGLLPRPGLWVMQQRMCQQWRLHTCLTPCLRMLLLMRLVHLCTSPQAASSPLNSGPLLMSAALFIIKRMQLHAQTCWLYWCNVQFIDDGKVKTAWCA